MIIGSSSSAGSGEDEDENTVLMALVPKLVKPGLSVVIADQKSSTGSGGSTAGVIEALPQLDVADEARGRNEESIESLSVLTPVMTRGNIYISHHKLLLLLLLLCDI